MSLIKKIKNWINPPLPDIVEVYEGEVELKYREENPPLMAWPPSMILVRRAHYDQNPDAFDFFMLRISGKNIHVPKRVWDMAEESEIVKLTIRSPNPGDSLVEAIEAAGKEEYTLIRISK